MKTLHLVCNSHIDPIWQWDWQEGVSATLSTFQSAVNLAEKYDYIFCHNEVTVYKYVEEYAPQLFEDIKKLVKQGKWHIVGGWYLQPDDNMPCGESFVRQIKMGQAYFKEKFGVVSTTAFNVDAFGHTRGLVQILKKCGQDSLIVCRPHTDEMPTESNLFWWEGFDGSKIKVFRSPDGYNSPLGDAVRNIKEKLENRKDEDVMCILWGVGNHGGGPSDKDLHDINRYIAEEKGIIVKHSTPEAFFAEAQPACSVDTSLRISMPGCYTSSIVVKQKHKQLEDELYLAEIMSATAAARGLLEYHEKELNGCFEDLLNAEFHDVLSGSCVQAGEQNGLMLLDHGMLDATRIKTKAFFALSSTQSVAAEGEYPVLVFNPHPYPLTENIECEFSLADQNWSETEVSYIIVKDGKKTVKSQVIKEESNLNLDWRKRIVFEATLPPMSMKRFGVFAEKRLKDISSTKNKLIFDNGHKYVEIDGKTGLLKSFCIDGTEYVKNGFCLMMFDDNADPWAMGSFQQSRLGTNPQPFEPMKKPSGVFEGMNKIQVREDGDICLCVEAFFEKNNSKAKIEYIIYKNTDDIDVNVTLFLQDVNKIVKLAVPVPDASEVIGQTAFGTEKLFDDGRENISQRFTAVKTKNRYLAVLDACRYGGHFENGTLFLSLARGATYCAHPIMDRQLLPSDKYTKKMDQCEHDYSFRICVCDRNVLDKKATEFCRKPYAVNIFPVKNNCKEKPFDFVVSDSEITLAAFKKQQNGEGYIARLVNNTPCEKSATLTICNRQTELCFGKYEVKTILYTNDEITELEQMEI